MSKTSIEWCVRPGTKPETWNPTTGCNKVSQGCKFCYAEIMHKRLQAMGQEKYRKPFLNGAAEHKDVLTLPLKWKTPRTVFVNSMSDLFHQDVSFLFINAVFSVMADVDIHTYIILTKRPQRMVEFFQWKKAFFGLTWQPAKNVWLGVSVEDQATADERILLLRDINASVKFLSCEPLLAPVDLVNLKNGKSDAFNDAGINWVICGGESGHKARPMHPDWATSLRDQCNAAGVHFFFKQWGEWMPDKVCETSEDYDSNPAVKMVQLIDENGIHDNKILLQEMWPCRYRMLKVGKKKAGRLLDGREWNEFPCM